MKIAANAEKQVPVFWVVGQTKIMQRRHMTCDMTFQFTKE